eukprot:5958136-Alexandrium_andersonii.AAC.1
MCIRDSSCSGHGRGGRPTGPSAIGPTRPGPGRAGCRAVGHGMGHAPGRASHGPSAHRLQFGFGQL